MIPSASPMSRPVRTAAIAALVCGMVPTVARGARAPNAFARAHWLLDYRFGFMKRALQGQVLVILSRIGVLHLRRETIFGAAYLVFGLLCAAMFAIAVRTLARDGWRRTTFAVLAAFLTSAYVLTAAHLMGYMDHLVALLAILAVWLAVRDRYWSAGVAITAAVLVHETVFLTGVPVLLMAIALRPNARRGSRLIAALAPMVLPVAAGATIVLTEQNAAHRAWLRGQLVRRLSAFPWITGDMNLLVPEWLTTSFVQHFREEVHAFPSRISSPGFVLYIVPSMVLLWLLSSALSGWRRVWMAAAALAIAFPLLLHMVAFDTAREWTYPLIAGLTCVWLSSESGNGRAAWGRISGRMTLALALAVVACNIFVMHYPMLDGEVDRFGIGLRALLYGPFLAAAAVVVFLGGRVHE